MALGGTLELVGMRSATSLLGPIGGIVAGIGMEIGTPPASFAMFTHEVF